MVRSGSSKSLKKLPPAARLRALRGRLAADSSVTVSGMAADLGVSEMTIRRDMEKLAGTTDLRRTHGGAVVAERMVFEFNYLERQRGGLARKKAIAAEARKLVSPGDRVILDTGTTTLELARLLKDSEGVTVITPSLAVASELQFCGSVSVVLLGGVLHRGSPDLTGPVTEHCLELFAADWVFQGAEGIGKDGSVYNIDLQLARVDRLMRSKSARSCLLADSSKVGITALVRTARLADFDVFITDAGVPAGFLRQARKAVRRVTVA